jgi:RNA polymerase sigma-70 factor (ECF subfamily)
MIMSTASSLSGSLALSNQDAGEIRAAVRRFIGARVKDSATADDLTQEVLLKVQQRLPQVRDPRRIMGWVIQIARNTITDHFRSARTMEVFSEEHATSDPRAMATNDRDESRLRDSLGAYIRSVVQGLPAIYREAIVLTDYDGLTQVELAARLGLSVSAAKSRVQRARAMVHQQIDRCCHFHVDHYGQVVDYTPKPQCGCAPLATRSHGRR